jgi:hypothetical protein
MEMEIALQLLLNTTVEAVELRLQLKILPRLYELDRINTSVANEMIRLHATENVTERFNDAWDGLKRLIYEIEQKGCSNDKEKNQLEA